MPKKRSAKERARYYTATQIARHRTPVTEDKPVKDVTTQLTELRIEQARERQLSRSKVMTTQVSTVISPLGFTPAHYTFDDCPHENRTQGRRIPGPAPPRSWSERPRNSLRRVSIPEMVRSRTDLHSPFPDVDLPSARTLFHQSLLVLATHFYRHQEINRYYLPQLSVEIKQWLLTYASVKNIGGAITREGLDVLFPRARSPTDPEEMKDIISLSVKDEVYIRCLDLSDSLGCRLSLSQLRSFLSPLVPSSSPSSEWSLDTPRFSNLTHLSLDVSPVHTPKFDHLKLVQTLSQHCSRLTHLSVAGIFTSATSASALVHLSKTLACLEYIDLSRNPVLHERYGNPYLSTWRDAPQEFQNAKGERLLDSLNWEGAWRRVRVLVVRKCGFTLDMEQDVQKCIIDKRGGKGWIQVVTT